MHNRYYAIKNMGHHAHLKEDKQPGFFSNRRPSWDESKVRVANAKEQCGSINRGQTQEHAQCTRTRSPAAKISRAKIQLKPLQNRCYAKKMNDND